METFTMLIYLASPYTPKGIPNLTEAQAAGIRSERFTQACAAALRLMEEGYEVFSPIAHSHSIEVLDGRLRPGDFWLKQDFAILKKCDKMFVLMLDGWEKSYGIKKEIEFANNNNIPVEYLEHDYLGKLEVSYGT
jgi:hypothetical protein